MRLKKYLLMVVSVLLIGLMPILSFAEKRTITIAQGNGDYVLELNGSDVQNKDVSTITLEANIDGATVIVGYKNSFGTFKAYNNGTITTVVDAFVRHGKGVILMIRITGMTANSVTIRY